MLGEDLAHSGGELRGYALGQTSAGRLLFVVLTVRRQLIRVISGRYMTQPSKGYHGDVTCIVVEGSVAKIAGVLPNGDSFNLYVEDTGEGHGNADPIFFDSMADTPDCGFDEPSNDDLQALACGNAQVRDGG